MLNLMNKVYVSLFGWGLDVDLNDVMFWLYVAQAAVVFIGIVMFFILLARTRRRKQEAVVTEVEEKPVVAETAATTVAEPQVIVVNPTPVTPEPEKETAERTLTGISLDVGVVQREFTAGDEFNCDGMLVRLNYNVEPFTETIISYSIVDGDVYDRLSNINDIKVCYVLRPDLSEAGIKFVSVKYADQTAIYTVYVKEAVAEEPKQEEPTPVVVEKVVEKIVEVEKPVIVERIVEKTTPIVEKEEHHPETILIGEETVEAGKLRYDRSFTARLIQSDDEVKHWYTEIKNRLLSYKKVHARISWKRETFKSGKEVVAKLAYRGKTICLFLPLNVAEFEDSKYSLEDESKIPSFADTPAMIRIKNEKHSRQALDLITLSMNKLGIKDVPHVSVDYYVPYEGVVELINKGLIKREIKTSADEAIFVRDKATEAEDVDNDTKTVTEIIVSSKTLDEAEEADDNTNGIIVVTEAEETSSTKEKKSKKGRK